MDIPSTQSLRTFLVLHNGKTELTGDLKFSSLRAFDARFVNPSTPVLALIDNLKHIRYLNLSRSDIEILPESSLFSKPSVDFGPQLLSFSS